MKYIADVHLHSHYSIATSKDLDPEHLFEGAAIKGIGLVGTGDFTHPGWRAELSEKLVPEQNGSGFFRLKPEFEEPVRARLPKPVAGAEVRFVLSAEISSIYKRADRTRKVHNLVLMPDMASVESLCAVLEKIGNIRSDGRPILGLDSEILLEMCLEACREVCFIPAHIWTPHFSALGAKSGFESLDQCYGSLTGHIYAVETGLSSDPPMNWRLSALDNYALVSNSDAHSPGKLGREANLFDTELSYESMTSALKARDASRFLGTLEFNPEEGKYHYDGHRACGVCLTPEQNRQLAGICPECGRRLTPGVLGRVAELADRPVGANPEAARHFERLVPLVEVLSEVLEVGTASKKVQGAYRRILDRLGPELFILRQLPLEELSRAAGETVAEAVRRVRAGELQVNPGFDGQYGTVKIFAPGEIQSASGQVFMFEDLKPDKGPEKKTKSSPPRNVHTTRMEKTPYGRSSGRKKHGDAIGSPGEQGAELFNERQLEAIACQPGPVAVVAGPGTGKTRCLAGRLAKFVGQRIVSPQQVLAVTFTNKAAREMRQRILKLLDGDTQRVRVMTVGTFHGFCLGLLAEVEKTGGKRLVVEEEVYALLSEALEAESAERPSGAGLRNLADRISRVKALGSGCEGCHVEEQVRSALEAYTRICNKYRVRDFDDLILDTTALLKNDPSILGQVRTRYRMILVDEFQDLNPAQYELVRMLAGEGAGLFVIGDLNQSIYGFRGADPLVFERLGRDFPKLKTITLELGYRCPEELALAAGELIARGGAPTVSPSSAKGPGGPVGMIRCPSDTAEGIAVVREIGRLVGGTGMLAADSQAAPDEVYSFSDCAVLTRTAALCEELERCFAVEGIPCRVRGARSFLRRSVVRRLVAFLRLAADDTDDFRFTESLRLAGCDPNDVYFRKLISNSSGGSPLLSRLKEALSRPAAVPPGAEVKRAEGFLLAVEKCHLQFETHNPQEILGKLVEQFVPVPGKGDSEAIEALLSTAGQYSSVREFLDNVSLRAEGDHERPGGGRAGQAEAVTLATMHAAKGLEFPVVFICGVEDGMIPYTWRETDPEEERRLFYVAMTRAGQRLYLTSAARRRVRGRLVQALWSPLVSDLQPTAFLERALEQLELAPGGSPGRQPGTLMFQQMWRQV
ncbi:MAG: UvrD-helicase domain-containing protein, partial [Gemmatimonadota bacterium]|nr:UvrD-helicase domain-containing protein [Gemmatimonadota bacterium]